MHKPVFCTLNMPCRSCVIGQQLLALLTESDLTSGSDFVSRCDIISRSDLISRSTKLAVLIIAWHCRSVGLNVSLYELPFAKILTGLRRLHQGLQCCLSLLNAKLAACMSYVMHIVSVNPKLLQDTTCWRLQLLCHLLLPQPFAASWHRPIIAPRYHAECHSKVSFATRVLSSDASPKPMVVMLPDQHPLRWLPASTFVTPACLAKCSLAYGIRQVCCCVQHVN